MNIPQKNKMVIITSYFDGESYGLLGPQMAATIINQHSGFHCIVIAVTRSDDKTRLIKALKAYFGSQRPIVGFSTLCGGVDLFQLAGELKSQGALTILAGPQAGIDYAGETNWQHHPNRFRGYHDCFTYALQGPAEQILPLLADVGEIDPPAISGLLYQGQSGIHRNQPANWQSTRLNAVDWSNIYRLGPEGFIPLPVFSAQVLQQIGCPHAIRTTPLTISPPTFMPDAPSIELSVRGCSFCDVAVDKEFCGAVNKAAVIEQIAGLPMDDTGRIVPFELIDENPFNRLPKLLMECEKENLAVSQINLTTRADYLVRGERHLVEALHLARKMRVRIICVSVGFESFSDTILTNLNKGVSLGDNLDAVALMRRLKRRFPFQWGYSRNDGGNHGFIHPTPWDTPQTAKAMEEVINSHQLAADILPAHSTPLIIHHGSGLGDWIRKLEKETEIQFNRRGSLVDWWEKDPRFSVDS